jgi:regulator of protease activity HflC (stomatin/prohibitin superfamily)
MIISGLTLLIILQGIRKIPADPPQVALVTFLGKRIKRVKREGWRFFFGYPYIFSYIPISIQKVNQDFVPQETRTPDNAEIKVPISITWQPNYQKPKDLINFIDSGGSEGVKNILQDIVSERIRQWARSLKEGPQTWEEAQASSAEATQVILETIIGDQVTAEGMDECRRGNGRFYLHSLGIVINRLNVGQIDSLGAVKEAAEKAAKEEQERKAEIIELEHVKKRIELFTEMGYSKEKALEIVQTERGKITKTIAENQFSLPPETREMIKEIILPLAGLAAKFTQKDKQP